MALPLTMLRDAERWSETHVMFVWCYVVQICTTNGLHCLFIIHYFVAIVKP